MTVYILGGGPAGLATAAGLMDAGFFDFVVIERDEALGGLARTVQWDGIGSHDLGPHKIFSLDTALVKRIERLLPAGDWLTREKISSIFMLSAVAILPALFIFWPAFANKAASLAGVAFPFVVMFSALLAILFIFIHRLVSIVHRLNADNRLLIQELALLREKVERMACQREQT